MSVKCSTCDYCQITSNPQTGVDVKCKFTGLELKHVVLWIAYTNGEGGEDAPEPMLDCPQYIPRGERSCEGCPSVLTVYADDTHANVLFYVCKRRHVIIGNTPGGKKCPII